MAMEDKTIECEFKEVRGQGVRRVIYTCFKLKIKTEVKLESKQTNHGIKDTQYKMLVHKDQGFPVRYGIRKLNCRNSDSMD